MTEDIKSPQFPESIFEGTLSSWLKKEGEEIKQDEVLAEIETDKVVIEVTAPSDGVMDKILVPEGSTIKSSDIIGRYKKGESAPSTPSKTKEPEKKVEKKPGAEKPITKMKKPAATKFDFKEAFSKAKDRVKNIGDALAAGTRAKSTRRSNNVISTVTDAYLRSKRKTDKKYIF